MPAPSFTIDGKIDLGQVDRAFYDLKAQARVLRPAWQKLRGPLRKDQAAHGKAQSDESSKWPPRSPITLAAYARARGRAKTNRQTKAAKTISPRPSKRRSFPRQILGRIPRSLKVEYGDLYLRGTARAPWAIAHQEGARVGRKRKVKLPRRRFLYPSRAFLNHAADVIGKHVVAKWSKVKR